MAYLFKLHFSVSFKLEELNKTICEKDEQIKKVLVNVYLYHNDVHILFIYKSVFIFNLFFF